MERNLVHFLIFCLLIAVMPRSIDAKIGKMRKSVKNILPVYKTVSETTTESADDEKVSLFSKYQPDHNEKLFNLSSSYDYRSIPAGEKPVIITLSVYIDQYNLDENEMTHSSAVYLTQEWQDDRLKNDRQNTNKYNIFITSPDETKIWLPDTFFDNEITGNDEKYLKSNKFNSLLKISPNGTVRYNRRLSAKFSCPLNLFWYPFGSQTCSIIISSFARFADEIKYEWRPHNPVTLSGNLQLRNFMIESVENKAKNIHLSTGQISNLEILIHLKRIPNAEIIRVYVPSVILLIAAYLSIFIDKSQLTSRIFLGGSSLIVMVLLIFHTNTVTPSANYIKALDMWTLVVLMIILIIIGESVTISYILSKKSKNSALKSLAEEERPTAENKDSIILNELLEKKCSSIDYAMRISLPFVFIGYTILYFYTVS